MPVLHRFALCAAALVAALPLGCGSALLPGGDGRGNTLTLSSLVEDETTFHESDANDLLNLAEFVAFANDPRVIRGSIDGADDVDVYDLGPVEPGDRVLVRMANDESLAGAVAAFDDHDAALLINDHRNVYLGVREPFIDIISRRASEALFIAVAATPGYDSTGDYGLVASRSSGNDLPTPRPDRILLVFSGGSDVIVGGRPAVDVPPFDAADIDPRFAGLTDVIVRDLVADVREDFAGLDIEILSTSEGAADDAVMTRIFFGTFDAALLGVAEGVDEFNARQRQTAIIFTDTFAAFSILQPSSSQMSQALANVASHEIGHLLGLVHSANVRDIMDVTASLRDLLDDQTFEVSPVHREVFPVGQQDAFRSLLDAVGGDDSILLQDARSEGSKLAGQKAAGPACRSHFVFSSCGLHED